MADGYDRCILGFNTTTNKTQLISCKPEKFKVGNMRSLKGLSHEIDFKNVVANGQILALIRAAGWFLNFSQAALIFSEIKHQFPGKC